MKPTTRRRTAGLLRNPALACAVLVALAPVPAPVVAAQQVFEFDVNLDKRPIGTHRFTVNRQADGTTSIQSAASFDVRFLGITAYRYRHQAAEQWKGECLATIDASTDDNGRNLRVTGLQRDGRFQLDMPAMAALPACLSAYAYWDRDLLLRQRTLLNPQTGKLDEMRVEPMGSETVQLKGQPVQAERYRLHAAQNIIDLWYSQRGDWLQLESTTGSRRLIYRLRQVP
jgi:hypothetical protein